MERISRALALALSLALVGGSVPPSAYAQTRGITLPGEALPDAPIVETPSDPGLSAPISPVGVPLGGEALPSQPLESISREAGTRAVALPVTRERETRTRGIQGAIGAAVKSDGAAGTDRTSGAISTIYDRSRMAPSAPATEADDTNILRSPTSHSEGDGHDDHDHDHDKDGEKAKKEKPQVDPLEALMDQYQVPKGERALRRRLTQQAIERIKLDLALFSGDSRVEVNFGEWWVTGQNLETGHKSIDIPLEDIFVRAVDEHGVEEAVGAAIHETAHYRITRMDKDSPLNAKYHPSTSPENNLLLNSIEDTRINTWAISQEPGSKAYFDAIYDDLFPENPDDTSASKRSRMEVLARSTLEVEHKDGKKEKIMPPHLQYTNSAIYYWRHRKAPPFLTDKDAIEAFDKTKQSLDRIRNIHPQHIGGVLTEPMKLKASMEAVEAIDKEIYPYYEKLVKKSQQQLKNMMKNGSKVKQGGGQGQKQGTPNTSMPQTGEENAEKVLKKQAGDVSERIHGSSGKGHRHHHPTPGSSSGDKKEKVAKEDPKGDQASEGMGGDESWMERREKAVKDREQTEKGWTLYERYRLRAKELGLIDKVDGVMKQILMPTRHARLSRSHYDEGDEPDIDKFLDDRSQGRLDSPIMRTWNRMIRRNAKISLVLDVSGSMGSLSPEMTSPLDYAVLGVVAWAEVCHKNNLDFEVILFADDQEIAHPFGRSVNQKAKDGLIEAVVKAARGSTAIGAAYKLALDRLKKQQATHRFIIFATDEGHNSGEGPEKYTEEAKKAGIVTIAMVIGADEGDYKKHFDYAVRVKEPRDFPKDLLKVLKAAVKQILGPAGFGAGFGDWADHDTPSFWSRLWTAMKMVAGFLQDSLRTSDRSPPPRAELPASQETSGGLRASAGVWERLAEAVGMAPEAAAKWRRRSISTLKSEPGLPFNDVLDRSIPESDPARRSVVLEKLHPEPQPLLKDIGSIHDVKSIDGKLYVAADSGIYEFDGAGHRHALGGKVRAISRVGGRIYAGFDDTDVLWSAPADSSAGPWKKETKVFASVIDDIAEVDGRPVLLYRKPADGSGKWTHHVRYKGRAGWSTPVFWGRLGEVTQIIQGGGRTYAAASKGLFVRTGTGWRRLAEHASTLAFAGGRLFFSDRWSGVYALEGDHPTRISPSFPEQRLLSVDDKLYATFAGGLTEWKDGRWEATVKLLNTQGAVSAGGSRYIYDYRTIYSWPQSNAGLLHDLKESALAEIASAIEAPQASPEPVREGDGLRGDSLGIVSRGRSIFSNLVAKLGASFGEPPETQAPQRDPWLDVTLRLAEELDLRLGEYKLEELKVAAAGVMRQEPGLPLDRAILHAFASTHAVPAEDIEKLESRLWGGPRLELSNVGFVNSTKIVDGTLHAATDHGLFELRPEGWKRYDGLEQALDFAKVDGRLYVGTAQGVVEQDGGGFKPSLTLPHQVLMVSELDGRPFADGSGEQYIRRWGKWWKLHRSGLGFVSKFLTLNGKQYAAGTRGLLERRWWGWKPLIRPTYVINGTLKDAVILDGRLVVANDDGVWQQDADGSWSGLMFSRDAHALIVIGGRLYVGSWDGIRVREGNGWKKIWSGPVFDFVPVGRDVFIRSNQAVFRWRPESNLIPKERQGPMLVDIAREMERLAAPDPDKPKLEGTDGGLKRGKRSIFSGLTSKLGAGFPAPAKPQPDSDPWRSAAERLGAEFGVASESLDPSALRGETGELLKSRPGMELDEALARSFGGLHGVPEDRIRSLIASLGERSKLSLVHDAGSWALRGASLADGRLIAWDSEGIHEYEDGRPPVRHPMKEVLYATRIGGKLYAADPLGLLVLEKDGWSRVFSGGSVFKVFEHDGSLFATTGERTYVRRWGRWWPFSISRRFFGIRDIQGRTFALTDTGLVERGRLGWWGTPTTGAAHDVVLFDGRILAATNDAIFRELSSGAWDWERLDGSPSLAIVDGRLVAASFAGAGLKEKGSNGWIDVDWVRGLPVRKILTAGDSVWLLAPSGLFRWSKPEPILSGAQAERALAELGSDAKQAASTSDPKPDELSTEEGGIGRRGRSIFSTMVSKLGAGFGPILKLGERLGLAKDDIDVDASLAASADALRQQPSLPLGEAVLAGVVKTNRASPERVAAVRRDVLGEYKLSLSVLGGVDSIRVIEGRAYAATEQGLFVRQEKGDWKKIYPLSGITDIAKIGGRWYLASKHGVDVADEPLIDEKTDWKTSLLGSGAARKIMELDGRPLVATEHGNRLLRFGIWWNQSHWCFFSPNFGGSRRVLRFAGRTFIVGSRLFRRTWYGWTRVKLPSNPIVEDALVHNGDLYLAASNGIWKMSPGKKPESIRNRPARSLGVVDGKLVAGDPDGFYELGANGWTTLIDRQYMHLEQIEPLGDGSFLLLGANSAYTWRPKRPLVDPKDETAILEELSDPWIAAAKKLAARFRLGSKRLDVEAFRRDASAELRSRPDLPLEPALVDAFAKSHGFAAEDAARVNAELASKIGLPVNRPDLLKAEPGREFVHRGTRYSVKVGQVRKKTRWGWETVWEYDVLYDAKMVNVAFDAAFVGDDLYIATESGIVCKHGNEWSKPIGDSSPSVAEFEGRLYYSTGRHLVAFDGSGIHTVLETPRPIRRLFSEKDGLYLVLDDEVRRWPNPPLLSRYQTKAFIFDGPENPAKSDTELGSEGSNITKGARTIFSAKKL
jgi:hypothetical protein